MNRYHQYVLAPLLTAGIVGLAANSANAISIAPTDLDSLHLGEKIVGPVGPTVDTAFINGDGDGVGDLISSVSCPAGFTACVPPDNPAGTLYTYIHQVTPGIDNPNDSPPFPNPLTVLPLDGASSFALTFAAEGFTGLAGYSFSEATAALGVGNGFNINRSADNLLSWHVRGSGSWDTGEPVSFFWQTTQAPSGPQGIYRVENSSLFGLANGPIPSPLPAVTNPDDVAIPEGPVSLISTVLALGGVLAFSKFRKKTTK